MIFNETEIKLAPKVHEALKKITEEQENETNVWKSSM